MADYNFVTSRLATGAAVTSADDVDQLLRAGLNVVVDARDDFNDAPLFISHAGVHYMWNPTPDDGEPKPVSYWARTLSFVMPLLAQPRFKAYLHCFPTGTLVGAPTPVPIELATETTGHDGRLHKVTAHSSREYNGPLTVIKSTGALPLRCTPEHPILVVRPYRWPNGQVAKPATPTWQNIATYVEHYRHEPRWVNAQDVQKGDFLVAPKPITSSEATEVQFPQRQRNVASNPHNKPKCTECEKPAIAHGWCQMHYMRWRTHGDVNTVLSPKAVSPLTPDPDIAWMIGVYVADGGTGGENGIQFVMSRSDDVERLVAVWRSLGLTPTARTYANYVRVYVASRPVSQAFAQWCGKSDTKRFPPFVFDGWPLEDVIAGYVSGDGHIDKKGHINCTTISPTLAEQLRAMLLQVGESPTLTPLRRVSGYPNAKPSVLTVRWAPAAMQRHTTWWRDMYLMPVKSVAEEYYVGQVHNLEVEDAETYTVNGITVHNCAAGINRGPSAAFAILVAQGLDPKLADQLIRQARPQAQIRYESDALAACQALGYIDGPVMDTDERGHQLVEVRFDARKPGKLYVYAWAGDGALVIGDRVRVPGTTTLATVVGLGSTYSGTPAVLTERVSGDDRIKARIAKERERQQANPPGPGAMQGDGGFPTAQTGADWW